ncbi:MAG: PAS domain S-box protein [Nitrospirae bacterium]|nr:PAS domain S-box protein [Nitrospirota bacterium]
MILYRVCITYLLLFSFFIYGTSYTLLIHTTLLSYFAAFIFLLTIVYLVTLQRLRSGYFVFAYVQVMLDIYLIIFFILATGGIESWFSFLLLVHVIGSGITLGRKPMMTIAVLSSISYGIVIVLQFYAIIPVYYSIGLTSEHFFFNIFTNMTAMFLVAYLGRHLLLSLERTSITLRKTESDFRDLYAFHRDVIENIPVGLLYTDTKGGIVLFNRSAEIITGIAQEAAKEKKLPDLFDFIPLPIEKGSFKGTILDGCNEKIVEASISEHRNEFDVVRGFVIIFEDLTRITEMEVEMKEKEKMAAIGELSANIAHEIRNPLAALRSSVEMLKEATLPQEQRGRIMEIAIVEMDRLNKIITDFLIYSNPRLPDIKRISATRVLKDTLYMLRNIVSNNNGDVNIVEDFEGDIYVKADENQVKQVFWNLGLNALQSLSGTGQISVSVKQTREFVKIYVKDSGRGIEPENMEKIFYPFFSTKKGGAGLGLAMVYRIIHEHSGKISVSSTVGKGTTFEISLLNG